MSKKDKTKELKRGRPKGSGKITVEAIDSICSSIESGKTIEQAAIEAGIHRDTLYRWKSKGKKAKSGIYRLFYDSFEAASEVLKSSLVEAAVNIALPHEQITKRQVIHPKTGEVITLEETRMVIDTSMLRFLLERRWPKEYGRKDKLDLGNTDDNPFQVSLFGAVMGQGEAGNC